MNNKQHEILDAAFSLLSEEGDVASLNLRKIARKAGCAHTNVYNYYPKLGSLKWAMLEKALERMEVRIFKSENASIEEIIRSYIEFALEHPELYKLIWTSDLPVEDAPRDLSFLTGIPRKLAEYMPAGPADILHSYVHGRLLSVIFNRSPFSDRNELIEEIIEGCSLILN